MRAAADRAIALGSYEQALSFLQSALTVVTEPSEEADLLDRAGRVANEAARLDEAETLLRRAIELRREMGDLSGLAGSFVLLNRTLTNGYRSEEAVALLEPAMEELADIDDEEAIVRLATALSGAYSMHQETDRALRVVEENIGRAERLDIIDVVIELIMRRGQLLGQKGRNYEALALTKGALELAETYGLVDKAMAARGNIGFHLTERDPVKALAFDRETLAETRRLGMRQRMLLILGNTSEEARFTGDWDWSTTELAGQLIGELDQVDRAWFLGNTLVFRGWRGEATGEDWAAWELLTEGDNDPQSVADYLDIRAARALGEGRLEDARRLAQESFTKVAGRSPGREAVAARAALWSADRAGAASDLAAIDETGIHGPAVEMRRATIRAGIAALDGQTADAIALYRGARDVWRELGVVWEEALTGIDMATLLDPREPEVQAAATRSREILTRLRARPFLERLDAALARRPETTTARQAEAGDRTAV